MPDKTPREELDDAIRILKEDGFHVRKHIQSELDRRFPDTAPKQEDPPKEEPGEGDPPPPKDPPADPGPKKDWWFRS